MAERSFRALVVREAPGGTWQRTLETRSISDLPPGEILIRVRYSSLNYKDALAAAGRRGVARVYPLTPGIDAAGTVVESAVDELRPGDDVLVTGRDLGVAVPGGFGQYIRVPADWAMKIPAGLSARECMILGTAGFTAALAVRTLEEHGVRPGRGEVLVTGASGGVGCLAVALLAARGHAVTAATGKTAEKEFLSSLGAARVIPREDSDDVSGKALLKERWAGTVDTVGGSILAAAVKATMYGGAVAACGNARSPDLPLTVFPFILRGVRLLGIESSHCPPALRRELWEKLAGEWKPPRLDAIAQECTLERLEERIEAILRGGVRGRVVVNLADA